MADDRIAQLEAQVAALRGELETMAELMGNALGNVAKAANYKLGGGLMGDFEAPKTAADFLARGLVKTGNL